jgi:hypothetical protein
VREFHNLQTDRDLHKSTAGTYARIDKNSSSGKSENTPTEDILINYRIEIVDLIMYMEVMCKINKSLRFNWQQYTEILSVQV